MKLLDAYKLAATLHAGQVDKGGRPYIEHLSRVFIRVLEQGGEPLGFVTLSQDGHLSLLYVSADHPRRGYGGLLLAAALAEAKRLGLTQLTTEASAFSYGLFLRYGFELTGLESVERGGVGFIRYRLHCRLPS